MPACGTLLKHGQHLTGAAQNRLGQAGELGHLNAIAAVRGAGRHFVQEHHLALPFPDLHGVVGQPGQGLGKAGQFVEMRGKQRPASGVIVQCLDGCPGDRQAIKSRRAAADFVKRLTTAGIEFTTIETGRSTLEDIFVDLVEKRA